MADLNEIIDRPLPPGQLRVLYCLVCGAITYLRMSGDAEGVGNPDLHNDYHVQRGDVPDGV